MTLKEELLGIMERLATTVPSRKVTIILCFDGTPAGATIYGSIKGGCNCTIMTVVSSQNIIFGIMDQAFKEANDYAKYCNQK